MHKHKVKKYIKKLKHPHILAGVLAVTLLVFVGLFYIFTKPSTPNKTDIFSDYSKKLISYYEKNSTFPTSLLELEGVDEQKITDATIVYRVEQPNGSSFTSFYGNPVPKQEGVLFCKFEMYSTSTDNEGQNIASEYRYSKNYCDSI